MSVRAWGPVPGGPPLDAAALAAWYPRARRPLLRVNFVSSLDGAVTLDGVSGALSGPGDRQVFDVLRMVCDALVVAAGTVRTEGYDALRLDADRRAWRRAHGLAEHPTVVVVSGSLDLDPDGSVFAGAPVRPVVLTHAGAPADRRRAVSRVADVVVAGDTAVDLPAALAALHARGAGQLLCEGGPRLLGALTAADLVDELCLTVSPLLAGPGAGRITAGPGSVPRHLALRHVLADDAMLFLRYARRDPPVGVEAAGDH